MTQPEQSLNEPVNDAKIALAWTHTARFVTTAAQLHHLPITELPEVAFVGRSNAGKSTAINALAQRKRLAFASKTPGRTQHINLFAVGPKDEPNALFADLPGYGYAKVAREAKLRWQKVMTDYLAVRRNLAGVVLLMDPRIGLTDLDHRLLKYVAPRIGNGEVKLLVVLTKADKLSRKEAAQALESAQQDLAEYITEEADVGVLLFSALNRQGLDDLALMLREWVDQAVVLKFPDQVSEEAGSDEDDRSTSTPEPEADAT